MEKISDKYYLLKSSILYGILGTFVLSVIYYLISLIVSKFAGESGAISFLIWPWIFTGSILPILIIPISFFCFVFPIRFFYIYFRLSKDKEIKSQKFVGGLFVLSLIFLIFSISYFWYLYSMGKFWFLMTSSYNESRVPGQIDIDRELIDHPEKADVFFEKAVQEKDYETIANHLAITFAELPPEFVGKVYNYAKENKKELSSVSGGDYESLDYYSQIISAISCNINAPIDIIVEIYYEDPENSNDACLLSNEDLPEEILQDIMNKYSEAEPDSYDYLLYQDGLQNLRNRELEK